MENNRHMIGNNKHVIGQNDIRWEIILSWSLLSLGNGFYLSVGMLGKKDRQNCQPNI